MSTEHSQALPRSVVLLRLLRRILSVTAVACAAAGMIASADALISGFGDGGDREYSTQQAKQYNGPRQSLRMFCRHKT